jgi:pimeloyl-ACP methyl ester carboxylesterase
MKPRIQYTETADGVRIALRTLGDGPPLVHVAGGPWSYLELWHLPERRHWHERLARRRALVGYDMLGTGLSERHATDYSLDALVRDVAEVVDHLGLRSFALFGGGYGGPTAIAYASRHPERVSRLVLWCTVARPPVDFPAWQRDAWLAPTELGWQLVTETCARLALGWSAGEAGRRAVEHLWASVTREAARAAAAAFMEVDVTGLLPQLRAPTLVLHRRDLVWLPVEAASDLAARIPDARLTVLEGDSSAPYIGDSEAVMAAIDAFLDMNPAPHQRLG